VDSGKRPAGVSGARDGAALEPPRRPTRHKARQCESAWTPRAGRERALHPAAHRQLGVTRGSGRWAPRPAARLVPSRPAGRV